MSRKVYRAKFQKHPELYARVFRLKTGSFVVAGIPLTTISQYENGKRKPKREALEKLSNCYGVDPKILLFRGRN